MTIARSRQVCLEQTRWYHCTTRCVRRAYICGFDSLTKRDFSHRKTWIEERLLFLSEVFCIDIAGYAIMSNHYHIVIRINLEKAHSLTCTEVVERWLRMHSGNTLARRFANGELLDSDERTELDCLIAHWRKQLVNISRFMSQINQYIARKANDEDGCDGKFWGARFNSQAILDANALLRTLAYVDLNPVRAKIATTPEKSEHTSLHRRLRKPDSGLYPFQRKPNPRDYTELELKETGSYLPIAFDEYLELLDWTGREIRQGKRGRIPADCPPIFSRLGYSPKQWLKSQQPTISWQQKALGASERIKAFCTAVGQRWMWEAEEHSITR